MLLFVASNEDYPSMFVFSRPVITKLYSLKLQKKMDLVFNCHRISVSIYGVVITVHNMFVFLV